MSNIFRSELIMPYAKAGYTAGIGEWVVRNGENAIRLKPAPFYQNSTNTDGSTRSAILDNEIQPNTQYICDLWIDVNDTYSGDAYRNGGLMIYYDDGTSSTDFRLIGSDGAGFQHKILITPAGKSISRINVYYGYNLPVYYRWDSYIAPITASNVNKVGQLNTCDIIENQEVASLSKGGSAYSNNFYEY